LLSNIRNAKRNTCLGVPLTSVEIPTKNSDQSICPLESKENHKHKKKHRNTISIHTCYSTLDHSVSICNNSTIRPDLCPTLQKPTKCFRTLEKEKQVNQQQQQSQTTAIKKTYTITQCRYVSQTN
jgi:hypothetical protein